MSVELAVADLAQGGGPGSVAVVQGLAPAWKGAVLSGPAVTCRCAPGDNLALYRVLEEAGPGGVIVCDAGGRVDGGYFGELMATDALARGIVGLVIDGSVRDVVELERLRFPVFHHGMYPHSCEKAVAPAVNVPVTLRGIAVRPGDRVAADTDAVVVIRAEDWPDVVSGARAVRQRESELRDAMAAGSRLSELVRIPPPS